MGQYIKRQVAATKRSYRSSEQTENPSQKEKFLRCNSINHKDKEELFLRFSRRGVRQQRLRGLFLRLFRMLVVQVSLGSKRFFDVITAGVFLISISPLLTILYLFFRFQDKGLKHTLRLGRWGIPFKEYSFPIREASSFLAKTRVFRLPILFNILKGDMSFIGPHLVAVGDLSPAQRAVQKRLSVRPGIVCLWWIRRKSNIDYGSDLETDAEYVDTQSFFGDIGIMIRAIPALLYGEGAATAPDKATILGIQFKNLTMSEAVGKIIKMLFSTEFHQVCFVNADCANIAYCGDDYLKILRKSDMVLADGIGIKLAGKLLANEIKQNVNGSDMFPLLCEALSVSGKGLFLLGGRTGVPEGVKDWINKEYPDVAVKGFQHGYFSPEEENTVLDKIRNSHAELLLVAFGTPFQEKWINRNLAKTGAKVGIGVGGLFDFYSGRIPRAPLWMREIGMEWLYRFRQEPGRMWKRYFVGNFVFLYRVMKER